MSNIRTFKLHWLGTEMSTEIIKGENIADAFTKAGYSAISVRQLDWYEEIKEEINIEDNLKYPECYTDPEICKKCTNFGKECTDQINTIDIVRHLNGEMI